MNNETIIRFSLSYDLNNYVDLGGCYAPSARHLHNSSDHTQLNHTDQTHMLIINFQRQSIGKSFRVGDQSKWRLVKENIK